MEGTSTAHVGVLRDSTPARDLRRMRGRSRSSCLPSRFERPRNTQRARCWLFQNQNYAQGLVGTSANFTPTQSASDPTMEAATDLLLVHTRDFSAHRKGTRQRVHERRGRRRYRGGRRRTIGSRHGHRDNVSPAIAAKMANTYAQQFIQYMAGQDSAAVIAAANQIGAKLNALQGAARNSSAAQELATRQAGPRYLRVATDRERAALSARDRAHDAIFAAPHTRPSARRLRRPDPRASPSPSLPISTDAFGTSTSSAEYSNGRFSGPSLQAAALPPSAGTVPTASAHPTARRFALSERTCVISTSTRTYGRLWGGDVGSARGRQVDGVVEPRERRCRVRPARPPD